MKERPIIMSDESVRAILNDNKTMTRRVVTGNALKMLTICTPDLVVRDLSPWNVGDHLWVKEVHTECLGTISVPFFSKVTRYPDFIDPITIFYRAEGEKSKLPHLPWKSAMFMRRLASRITLEITEVRIERLQNITAKDAIAEGIPAPYVARDEFEPISMYNEQWQKLNAKRGYPWELNPWVWVIKFRSI